MVADLIQEGPRSFLFAFEFPPINLPPTSEQPLIAYSFQAKLAVDDRPESRETLPFSHTTEIMEYRTKPLRISFIPNVDPSLETPLVSRKPSMRKKRSAEKNGLHKKSEARHSAQTIYPPGSPTSETPKFRGPKLTLTTADLDFSESGNSTPIIDRPHPSVLPSAIERTTRITDDDNNTIAKLTIEMPSSRFLPGENIAMKLTLQVKDGIPLPKGLGARVIETRALCAESPDGEVAEKEKLDEDEEQDPDLVKMKVVGKEQLRVLTGKKFILHHEAVKTVESQDSGLAGGKEIVEMMTVTLPPFETFITDALLPTATLPLGDPRSTLPDDPSPTTTSSSPAPRITLNGKGKSIDTSSTHSSTQAKETAALYFRVQHIVQITVPMVEQSGGGHWYSKANTADLEVAVPIILGNKNPKSSRSTPAPEIRLNKRVFESVAGSSEVGARGWTKGMKFGTLREGVGRPRFVVDG
jgi:hypothetical protein